MVRWICSVRPDDRIFTVELKTRLKLKSMRERLQDRRLQWFGHIERIEESAWSSKCRTVYVSGGFLRGRPKEIWNEVIRSGLKESQQVHS